MRRQDRLASRLFSFGTPLSDKVSRQEVIPSSRRKHMTLEQLYDTVIMDHINNARNFRALAAPDRKAEALSTLCGDSVTVYLKLDGERIADVAFQCSSCAISMASASIMTEAVKGKSRGEVEALSSEVTRAITENRASEETAFNADQAAIFAALRAFPARKTCATVAWHALTAALRGENTTVPVE
jgi:nitrogen fixation protein NifU and related proteins